MISGDDFDDVWIIGSTALGQRLQFVMTDAGCAQQVPTDMWPGRLFWVDEDDAANACLGHDRGDGGTDGAASQTSNARLAQAREPGVLPPAVDPGGIDAVYLWSPVHN
jgi:hypothetical protein